MSLRLSANFTLAEMVRSNTAIERGIKNKPTIQHIAHATAHANLVLQPLRDRVGPVQITSWYRCPELNVAVGGSKTSNHMTGGTSDLRIKGMEAPDIIKLIKEMGLPFDQLIDEGFYNAAGDWISWVHCGSPPAFGAKPRGEILLARGDRRNPTYTVG